MFNFFLENFYFEQIDTKEHRLPTYCYDKIKKEN